MCDRRDRRDDRRGGHHDGERERCRDEGEHGDGHEHRHHHDCCEGGPEHERHEDCREGGGSGPDTRFLQLEMDQVLYDEAESVAKDALRALLLDAARARLQQRFGDKIAGLAELAADELMADIVTSLNIEAHIEHRNRERGRLRERLSDIFRSRGESGESGSDREAHGERDDRSPGSDDDDRTGC